MRALLVPVKAFTEAKHRLAAALGDAERAALARRLGAIVLGARGSLDAFVACDDGAVADWAVEAEAFVLWTPGLGLSGAVNAGVAYLAAHGFDLAVVAHADLPFVESFDGFGREEDVTIAPDWRRDGTNVCAVPTRAGFNFAYGPGSFARHRAEARRLGLALEVVEDDRYGRDIDVPDDLGLIPHLLERAVVAGDASGPAS